MNSTVPKPYFVPPSWRWDGNDGRWSTFTIRVGTPEQEFRILPATAKSWTYVPVGGCSTDKPDLPQCGDSRGVLPFNGSNSTGFSRSSSSTWQNATTKVLDKGARADTNYGRDTIRLGIPNSESLTLEAQIVGQMRSDDFYLGSLGIGVEGFHLTNSSDLEPSFLMNLKKKNLIPSLSFAYTAGAMYRTPQLPGSLTLGGYDASRFIANTHNFKIEPVCPNKLTVRLQGITAYSTPFGLRELLVNPFPVGIDSSVSHLWLPRKECDKFADIFGLTYDEKTDLYLVNDTMHAQLQKFQPSFEFSLGDLDSEISASNDSATTGPVTIKIPYGALDLQASWPLFDKTTNYFPIRRAPDEGPYKLGRAFLQEAYMIVDYERSNFSIHQGRFSVPMPEHDMVTINSPRQNNLSNSTDESPKKAFHAKFSTSSIIGTTIGLTAITALFAMMIFFCFRRRHNLKFCRSAEQRRGLVTPASEETSELYTAIPEMHGSKGGIEVDGMQQINLASDDAQNKNNCALKTGLYYELSAEGEKVLSNKGSESPSVAPLRRARTL